MSDIHDETKEDVEEANDKITKITRKVALEVGGKELKGIISKLTKETNDLIKKLTEIKVQTRRNTIEWDRTDKTYQQQKY